jgi:hypothetical protein
MSNRRIKRIDGGQAHRDLRVEGLQGRRAHQGDDQARRRVPARLHPALGAQALRAGCAPFGLPAGAERHRPRIAGSARPEHRRKVRRQPRPACVKCGGREWRHTRTRSRPRSPARRRAKTARPVVAQGLGGYFLVPRIRAETVPERAAASGRASGGHRLPKRGTAGHPAASDPSGAQKPSPVVAVVLAEMLDTRNEPA